MKEYHLSKFKGGNMMQSPDIKEARIINDYNILISFEDGEQKVFDLKPYLD